MCHAQSDVEDERGSHPRDWLLPYVTFLVGGVVLNVRPHLIQCNFVWDVFTSTCPP